MAFRPFLRDVSTFGAASALTAGLGVLQVFLVPKLLDVETFGLLRIFLLYAAYIGVLHLGLADGALLRWAGRDAAQIAGEWRRTAPWLLLGQGGIALVAVGVATWLLGPPIASLVAGLGTAALVVNWSTLATFALQAARDFRWAGAALVLQPALFLGALLALPAGLRSIQAAMALWLGSHALTGALIGLRLWSLGAGTLSPVSAAGLLRLGSLAMLANFAAGLLQSADRVVLSWAIPVEQFALYGFAASALFAANAATQALARVALPHAARLDSRAKGAFYHKLHDLILAGYGLGLLAYPAFEAVVRQWLPAYVPALPMARALLAGALFWVASQVVQATEFRVSGRLARQLLVTLLGAGLVASSTGISLAGGTSLPWVAAAASLGVATAWLLGNWALRGRNTGSEVLGAARFAALGLAQLGALLVSMTVFHGVIAQTFAYAALAAAPTGLAVRWLVAAPPALPEATVEVGG